MKIKNVANYDVSFMECLSNILEKGHRKSDRTGVGTTSQFGCAMAFDIRNKGVPLLTLRNTNPQNAIVENLWFLSGNTDIKFLKDNNVGIWDEWVIPETAVFRDYTEDEYFTNYKKFYHDKPEYGNGEDPQYGKYVVCTYRDGLNWIRCTEPELYKKFVRQYPKGTDRQELIMFLGGQHGFKLSNKKLVSGSIGSGAYGSQWRNWEDTRLVDPHDITIYLNRGYSEVARTPYDGGKVVVTRKVDQYAKVIELLKNNPDSRRIIVTGWNPGKLEDAALPPCHLYHQYYTRELTYDELTKRINGAGYAFPNGIHLDGLKQICQENNIPTRALSILVLCRSQDTILGTPSNIFQYSVIAHMVAQVVGMEAEQLIWIGADTHVYDNHHKGFAEMIERFKDGKLAIQTARIEMNPAVKNIDDFSVNDIRLVDYLHRKEPLVFPIAV